MASTKEPSCSGAGAKVELTMETLSRENDDDRPSTHKPSSVSEDSVSSDEAGPCIVTAVQRVIGYTTASRRGTKRSIGEVSESETSDLDNTNKSSKVDSSSRDDTSRVCSVSVTCTTLDTSSVGICTETQEDQSTKKAKASRASTNLNECIITTFRNIRTNNTANNIIKSFNSSASNNIISSNTSDGSSVVKGNNNNSNSNANSTKKMIHNTNSNDSSNSMHSRVCNDISNTSAASNSSDTRSMSSTKTAAVTIVTSSSSCSRISASCRETSDNSDNRTSSDTNNNRNAVNNNSDDSCQSQSSEGGRTPTLAAGRKVYGLRPRSSRRLWAPERPTPDDESSESPSDSSIPSEQKTAGTKSTCGVSSKSRQSSSSKSRGTRTKPLSKYRRITANARERERMAEINTAFAALRAALPTIADYRIASMTKYTTLQLASSYIRDLSKLLDETPSSDSENKKENCPTYLHGALSSSNRRDVNLSVDISELSFERNQQSGSEDKPGDFSVFPNTVNSINNITEEQLEGLGDIENLSDMCWALDFMLD